MKVDLKSKHIEAGVLYGIGVMCGKHNLKITKEECTKLAKEYAKEVLLSETAEELPS